MPRVTDCEVKEIRPTEIDTMPMIIAANMIVDQINPVCGKSFDESQLTIVELWLAAHFVGTIDPVKIEEKFENYSVKYHLGSDSLIGIKSDKYGQTANMLSGGCLADAGKMSATVDFL